MQQVTIEELVDRYSVLLLDSAGVLVLDSAGTPADGDTLPGAIDLISMLNRIDKPYYIVTNDSSRLPHTRAEWFKHRGLEIHQDRIITSGGLLPNYVEKNSLQRSRCVVLGTQDSVRYVQNAGGLVVSTDASFDVLVIASQSGYPFLESVDQVLSNLIRQLDHGDPVHLVCPNPDIAYPAGGQAWAIAPGGVATLFETALKWRYPDREDLSFTRLGKPHEAMFAEALRRSGTMDMVIIGDQLETDIQGANLFGLDSVLLTSDAETPTAASLPSRLRPTYRIHTLIRKPHT